MAALGCGFNRPHSCEIVEITMDTGLDDYGRSELHYAASLARTIANYDVAQYFSDLPE